MSAKKSSSDHSKKAIDIHTPGQTKPSSTSRPIIVKNTPLAQDPMVSGKVEEADDDTATAANTSPKVVTHGRTIMPLSTGDKEDSRDEPVGKQAPTANELVSKLESQHKAAQKDEQSVENQASKPDKPSHSQKQPEDKQEEADERTNADESNTVDADEPESAAEKSTDTDAGEAKPASEKAESDDASEAEAEVKRQAELEELVASGKYFVPINAVRRRRDRLWLALLLVIVLAIIALGILLDAGRLHIDGFTPPTDFFQDKTSQPLGGSCFNDQYYNTHPYCKQV